MLWLALGILGGLVVLLGLFLLVMYAVGARMEPNHEFSCTLRLRQPAEAVFAAVDDVAGWPSWDKGVARVEMLPPTDGRETCRMHMGHNPMVLVTTRREPPRVLERTMEDAGKHRMFSGSWLHEIAPEGAGCVVKLTERGTIHMAIPRAMARKLADPRMYLKRHLKVLAAKFGEEARIG